MKGTYVSFLIPSVSIQLSAKPERCRTAIDQEETGPFPRPVSAGVFSPERMMGSRGQCICDEPRPYSHGDVGTPCSSLRYL